tara:strand:+ start:177 stop:809 length:633 start_codon:yes stop_codon:yes gene_type:complete
MSIFIILLLGFVWYQIIAIFGPTIGLHRYFSHKQFKKVSNTFETISLFLSMLAGVKSPLGWIGAHRMHHKYSDTKNDPHSPTHKGFWNIFFNNWHVDRIPKTYIKDVLKNPRVMFFHKHWKTLHISFAVITLLISLELFLILVLIPYILGHIGYGSFNALGHRDNKPVENMFINILTAGEGWHDKHHRNPKKIYLDKYDISGFIIERYFT